MNQKPPKENMSKIFPKFVDLLVSVVTLFMVVYLLVQYIRGEMTYAEIMPIFYALLTFMVLQELVCIRRSFERKSENTTP
jgi:FlaA1/EpsC-like NDP-sugar epimerase